MFLHFTNTSILFFILCEWNGFGIIGKDSGNLGSVESYPSLYKAMEGPKVTWPGEPSKVLWLLSMAR
jgi:hypothetical protein